MISAPSLSGAALLIGLSLFLGFAFEDFFAHSNIRRPGGIRTFPMLSCAARAIRVMQLRQSRAAVALTSGDDRAT